MKILIARHAEDKGPDFEDERRILSSRGVVQANQLAVIIKKFNPTHIYSSSLTRSKQTAQIISDVCKISFIENSLFNEHRSGNKTEVDSSRNGYVFFKESFEGGETYKELFSRTKKAFKWLKNSHQDISEDRIVLITHGRFMTFLISIMLGFKPDGFNLALENCSYALFQIIPNWRPQLILPIAEGI